MTGKIFMVSGKLTVKIVLLLFKIYCHINSYICLQNRTILSTANVILSYRGVNRGLEIFQEPSLSDAELEPGASNHIPFPHCLRVFIFII